MADQKIDICGVTVWIGPGPTGGPLTFGTPLPVELLYFAAEKNNKNVDLKWSTATESNNDNFKVQRSVDAINFDDIAEIDGAGSSFVKLDYSYTDENPYQGSSYYRLKTTDFSGNFKYSEIATINIKKVEILNFYPNPATENSNVIINSPEEMQISFVITSSDGKIISKRSEKLNKGVNLLNLDLSTTAAGN